MAEMASEQIRRATRDGQAGLTPSVYDEDTGPTSPITDREESVFMNEAVDESVRLEQTGETDDAEVLQAVSTLASMSTEKTDRERMPPPGGVMRAKIALGLARTESSSAPAESVSDDNRELDPTRPVEEQLTEGGVSRTTSASGQGGKRSKSSLDRTLPIGVRRAWYSSPVGRGIR